MLNLANDPKGYYNLSLHITPKPIISRPTGLLTALATQHIIKHIAHLVMYNAFYNELYTRTFTDSNLLSTFNIYLSYIVGHPVSRRRFSFCIPSSQGRSQY